MTVTATGQNKVYDGGRLATVTLASDKVTGDMLNLAGTASFADKNVGTAKTVSVGGINVTGIDAGNYRFNTVASTSADITARALTVTASGKNKVYDGNTSATVTLASDKVVGDMLNLAGTASFADKNVGIAKTITVGGISLTGADAGNYSFNMVASASADITARALTVTATGKNKVYDGGTFANVTLASDQVTGDMLNLGGNANFADKNVGIAKTINVGGITLTGADAGNYSFNTVASASAEITARALTVTATGKNKVYDGNTSATVTLGSDKIAGDVLNLAGNASFADKNVGIAKTITVGGISLTGADAGNYSLNTVASASADITVRALTVTATGKNKVYDGNTSVTVTLASDKVTGDMLNLAGNASFADKNVGTAKTISVGGIALTGADAGNYSFNTIASASANITARALTVTATGKNKVYDGNTSVTVTLASDKVTGDMLNLAGNASFADKNVGTAKTITVGGINVTGIDAGNYSFNTVASASADITARALTITATGKNKVYDGNTSATVALASDKIAGDMLNLAGNASFADKNVGTAKTITASGITVTGIDAGNYSFNTVASASADITARALTITATGNNKVYDGNTSANVTLGSDKVARDVLNLGGSASFADKNVGTAKTVNVGGITVTGTDAGNYSFNNVAFTSADITARALTITATGQNKVYDGNTSATVTLGSDKLAGDMLNLGGNARFADKNVGTAKTITVGGITVSGTDASNYSINTVASASADITARALTITATGQNKIYDGNTSATVTLASDKVAGDVLDLGGSASFADKNVGTAKSVTVGGINVTGIDAGNYSFNTATSTSADITARALTITAAGQNKVYDGNTSATVTLGSNNVAGDVLNITSNASFSDKNVGTAKTISVGSILLTGADAGNYSFNTSASASADITARALTVTATGQNKVYDGNTSATVTLASDKVTGDVLNLAGTASFADKNVGTAKTITASGITVTGIDAGNYSFNNIASASADITLRALTVTAAGQNKVYDGGTLAAVTLASNKVTGDVLNLGSTASFADKNVGRAKTITVGSITVSGTDASNYSINTVASASADITARALTITATGQNKIYDGNTSATVALASDKVAGDMLDLASTTSFADKNVGIAKTISVGGITLTGADAGNYSFNTVASASADITARALTITATGKNRIYDGNTSATVTLGSDKVAGDVLNFGGNASFADKNVGPAKTITVGGITVTGIDAGNYSFNTATSTSADITARALTITANGQNKVYSGNTSATVTLASDKVTGDVLNLAGNASFADKNVGTAKTISVGGITVSGTDAVNYNFNTIASASANITARALTITATGQNKVYDGNTSATLTLASDKVAGDMLNLAGTASFADKNVGTAKTVTASGISVTGPDASNYSFNTVASTGADITTRPLTVTPTGQNKVYDGGTSASVTLASDKIAGDELTLASGSAIFNSRNAASMVGIKVIGITAGGTDAGNYALVRNTAVTSAAIAPRALSVSANNDTRPFSNLLYSGGNGVVYSGFVAGDGVSDLLGKLVYAGSSQGARLPGNYVIAPGGLSSLSGNYAPGYVSGTLVILPSPLFGPLMVTNPSMVTSLLSQSGVTSAALWGFGGIPTLINVSDCALQAVTGLDGAQGKSGAGCTPTHSIEAMGKVLDATAAEDGQ